MSESAGAPNRLIYGPAEFAGYEGVVLDAETAARWAAASCAATWGEFARAMYDMSWVEYVEWAALDDDEVAAEDAIDFDEWINGTSDMGPQEIGHDTGADRVRELNTERPEALAGVRLGGASPGGNINILSGPLDQLELIASLIDPERDGFTLERDDAAVEAGMLRQLYG